MKKLLFILIVLVSCNKETKKQQRSFGFVEDDPKRVAQIPLIASEEQNARGGEKGKPVKPPPGPPSTFSLATPVPGNQGQEGSCVAFATAYAARSIEQYYRTGANSYSTSINIFSAEYTYNQTKVWDCSKGTAITICLDLFVTKGVCTESTMPYSDANGCDLLPTESQDAEAANYKILNYGKLLKEDRAGIKAMLLNNHPIIISMATDNSFINAGKGFIWKVYDGTGGIGHTVVIVGYDDSKNAYKIINSWGTGWGDGGFSWIDYDFFPVRVGYYVYVMNY